MTPETFSAERLIALRKLTRAVSEKFHARMLEYLATLAPLLRPKAVLGDYVQGASKDYAKTADRAFKELQALYDTLSAAKPFTLRTPLASPLNVSGGTLEVTPVEYSYQAVAGDVTRQVTVRSPLRWTLSYPGYSPARFRELLAAHHRSGEQIHDALVHYLVLHTVVSAQPGVADLLGALHFRVSAGRMADLGDLPVIEIATPVGTVRPPDDVIVRSAELSGMDAFEEVIDLEALKRFADPLRAELRALARAHGESIEGD
jgi:hypothetical protein